MTPSDRGRVWILEDSPLEAEMARRALAGTQDVEVFTDAAVVLERAATGSLPDILVLDVHLPAVGGVDVCRVLRARHDAMELPILILTAFGDKGDIVHALEAGANDYVTKPYDVAELVARVGTLVRASRLQATQARRQRQLALSAEIGAALTQGRTLEELSRRCCEVLAVHLDLLAVAVWVRRGGEFELAARKEDGPPIADELITSVANGGAPLVVSDVAERSELAPCRGARGFAALPLVVREEVVGVVAFCTRQPVSDATATLGTLLDLLALGIARQRFEEERASIVERERNIRAEAEAANRSKDEFLAMVSHELRTPLNAITGWTGMLLTGNLDPDRVRRALETIDRNARAQAQLIDDLLDISRIISGKLRLNVGAVDVPSISEMALESVRLAADARGVTLDAEIERDAGQVTGDADRMQQVIWNLLSNAIKFTPRGGRVVLRLGRMDAGVADAATSADEGGIRIEVTDTGQGITPEFLPYVFERFKQADGTMTRAKGGLGLGLAIVRHLVELHGGTIRARSDGAGRGATFVVYLPAQATVRPEGRAAMTLNGPRPNLEPPREIEGLRVLVVDDEPDARELLRALLESCKIDVTTVASAAEAFDEVKKTKFDIVLSDIAMPGEDGLSLIRRVRELSRDQGGRVPAVALTAYARLEDRTRALRAGFNTHVAKPVEPTELLAVLASLARS